MPELPEVESIRLSLLPVVVGRVISEVVILTPGVFLAGDFPAAGWRVASLERRGKYLIFQLERPDGAAARMVVHLRMTGQLLLETTDQPPLKHTHVKFRLDPAEQGPDSRPVWLAYHDTRRFGRLRLLPPAGEGDALLDKLGPEPLDPLFDALLLASRLHRRARASLKAALLDQTVVAGLGNIYADEVLYASKLNPARQVGSLSSYEMADLAGAIPLVISRAITCQGTTLRDYVNGRNEKGTYQDCLMVYGRAGQACRRCGQTISRGRLAGRTTCWCPTCQPEPEQLRRMQNGDQEAK